ncbi:MAG: hypothetical protein NVSMB2_19420 [Chloroflexota bacterium]
MSRTRVYACDTLERVTTDQSGGGASAAPRRPFRFGVVAIGYPPETIGSVAFERVGWIRDAAGPRFAELELNMNLTAVGDPVPGWIAATTGVTARDLAERGSIALVSGDVEQMCGQLRDRRERLGISYVLVSDELMEAFAPVVERLAGT